MKQLAIILILGLFLSTSAVQAQQKFGHINSKDLIVMMPGYKKAQDSLAMYERQLREDYKGLENDFQRKALDYEDIKNKPNTSKAILEIKRKDLEELQAKIQEFSMLAQDDLLDREKELFTPLLEKAKKAIEEVAKEGAFTYVLDSSTAALLYFKDSEDLIEKVKKKLKL